ncbi:hypothetical protein PY093_07970 [Cytobacillus sp. S13-E01]|uniref:hypothetical protein n=1 Tax=Cytobacillus sp. S13-E01 TaxID=3031326 RepID=UPI0023D7C4B6|nr:hypothetical protein [Cytobacillus sp. S13-E01]MDF0726650.1 hypothetical protein [Cytobacillus sp. S13-E01]
MTKKTIQQEERARNISGSFQVADDKRQKDLQDIDNEQGLDEESIYYARQFMED